MTMARVELPYVSKMKVAHCWDVKMEAAVVVYSRANIVPVGNIGGPQRTYGRIIIDKGFSSLRSRCMLAKLNLLISGDCTVRSRRGLV